MSRAVAVERLGELCCQVGESPLWDPDAQALWFVDIEGRRLHRWAGGAMRQWATAQRPASLARHAAGGLLCAMDDGLFHLQPGLEAGPPEVAGAPLPATRLCSVAHARPGMRFNDGRTDRAGRFWASTMVMDMSLASPAGVLHRFDGGLSAPLVGGLRVGNGLGFSPDGGTMYLSDSHPTVRCVWAFDLGADGTPSARRLFVDMNRHGGRPDGAAVDTDGGYWICANDGGAVLRFTPEGRLDRSIALPVDKPAMCAFGGPRLDELYITSIRPAVVPPAQAALAGGLFVCRPGAQGLADTPFDPAPRS